VRVLPVIIASLLFLLSKQYICNFYFVPKRYFCFGGGCRDDFVRVLPVSNRATRPGLAKRRASVS